MHDKSHTLKKKNYKAINSINFQLHSFYNISHWILFRPWIFLIIMEEINAVPCYLQPYREHDSQWFICVVNFTSRGNLLPFRLCSEPSAVALHRPQWNVILPTLNLDLSPPPLMKYWPFRLITTEKHDTHTHTHSMTVWRVHTWAICNCALLSAFLIAHTSAFISSPQ